MNSVTGFGKNPPLVLDAQASPAEGKAGAVDGLQKEAGGNQFGDMLSDLSKRDGQTGELDSRSTSRSLPDPAAPPLIRQIFLFSAGSMIAAGQSGGGEEAQPNVASVASNNPNLAAGSGVAEASANPLLADAPRRDQPAPPGGAPDASSAAATKPRLAIQDLGSEVLALAESARTNDGAASIAAPAPHADRRIAFVRAAPDPSSGTAEAGRKNHRGEAGALTDSGSGAVEAVQRSALPAGGVEIFGSGAFRPSAVDRETTVDSGGKPSPAKSSSAAISSASSALGGALMQLGGASDLNLTRRSGSSGETGAAHFLAPSDAGSAAASWVADSHSAHAANRLAGADPLFAVAPQGTDDETQLVLPPAARMMRQEMAQAIGQATDGIAGRGIERQAIGVTDAPWLSRPPLIKVGLSEAAPAGQSDVPIDPGSSLAAPTQIKAKVLDQQTHLPPVFGVSPSLQIADWVTLEAGSARIASSESAEGGLSVGGPGETSAPGSLGPSSTKILNLQLEPESLGVVTIKMRLSGMRLDLELEAARPETSRLIGADKDLLVDKLRSTGYSMEGLIIKSAEHLGEPMQGGFGSAHGASDPTAAQGNAQSPSSTATQHGGSNANDRSPTPRSRDMSPAKAVEDLQEHSGAGLFI